VHVSVLCILNTSFICNKTVSTHVCPFVFLQITLLLNIWSYLLHTCMYQQLHLFHVVISKTCKHLCWCGEPSYTTVMRVVSRVKKPFVCVTCYNPKPHFNCGKLKLKCKCAPNKNLRNLINVWIEVSQRTGKWYFRWSVGARQHTGSLSFLMLLV